MAAPPSRIERMPSTTAFNLGAIVLINARIDYPETSDPVNSQLNDMALLDGLLCRLAERCGLTVLGTASHAFEPYGITICKILSESHISIHTWPERNAFAMDIYSCRDDLILEDIAEEIRRVLPSLDSHTIMKHRRDV